MTILNVRRALVAVAALAALALPLAACGSSSEEASSTTAAAGTGDRAELQACLREQGVDLPTPPAGGQSGPLAGRSGRGGFLGRDLSDAERRSMQAAFEKCGGGPGGPGGPGMAGGRGGRPDTAALQRFVACVRENGYDLPDPNTDGDGPVFDDSAVDRDDPAFVRASRACQRYLSPSS